MQQQLETLFAESHAILDEQKFRKEELDYSILDRYSVLLQYLEELEGNCLEIFDLHQRKHIFFSKKFNAMFGFEKEEELDESIHPDDRIRLLEVGNHFMRVGYALPTEEKKNYKLINDFRIRTKDHRLIRVTKQYIALELDPRGNIWLALCTMNVSPDADVNAPVKSKVVNIKTGEVHFFPKDKSSELKKSPLSEREIQIVELLARGYSSKLIADKLFISTHTVNTHRQRIIEKLGVKNTANAIKIAGEMGLIG